MNIESSIKKGSTRQDSWETRPFQCIAFLNSNNQTNMTNEDTSSVSKSISIITGVTDKSYLHIRNNDYEYKYKLHLKHTKCSLTYREFLAKTGRYAGGTQS